MLSQTTTRADEIFRKHAPSLLIRETTWAPGSRQSSHETQLKYGSVLLTIPALCCDGKLPLYKIKAKEAN